MRKCGKKIILIFRFLSLDTLDGGRIGNTGKRELLGESVDVVRELLESLARGALALGHALDEIDELLRARLLLSLEL